MTRRAWALALLFALSLWLVLYGVSRGTEGNLRIGVFLVNWTDDTSQIIDPALVHDQMFIQERSVAAFYRDTTYSQIEMYGDVLGWFTVDPPKSGGCAASLWARNARDQLGAQGIDPYSYAKRVYMWRSAGCAWTGFAAGNDVYINYLSPNGILKSTIAHELGHTFGLTHADILRCLDEDGLQVSLALDRGDTCAVWNYGDRYDTMGNSSFSGFNAIHRTMAGWLPVTDTQIVTTAGTYTLVPLEWSSGVRQIEVVPPRKGQNYPTHLCLEVRQSYGWDQFGSNLYATNGIHVHQSYSCLTTNSPGISGFGSRMIDATPNSASDQYGPGTETLDYPLPFGQTMRGPGVTITVLSIGPDGGTVQVAYPKGNQ